MILLTGLLQYCKEVKERRLSAVTAGCCILGSTEKTVKI
jgi:hypothetical protein